MLYELCDAAMVVFPFTSVLCNCFWWILFLCCFSADTGVILPSWSVPQLRPAVPCAPAHVPPGVLSCPAHTTHASAHTAVRSVHYTSLYCQLPPLKKKKNAKSYWVSSLPGERLIVNSLGSALFCQVKYAETKIVFFHGKAVTALSFSLFHLECTEAGSVFIQ